MADTAFTVKVDDRTIVLDRITLGDWRMFRTEFGLKASDITTSIKGPNGTVEVLNLDDPSVLIALIVAALRHENPLAPLADVVAEAEAFGMAGITFPDLQSASGESESEPDPTKAGDGSEATASPAKSGQSAKRRKQPGTPS